MMKKNRIVYIVIFASLIVASGLVCFDMFVGGSFGESSFRLRSTNSSYKAFIEAVDNGEVERVLISDDKIEWVEKETKKRHVTQNPRSATLNERLLMNGVDVKVEKNAGEILSIAFDVIFYLFFFGVIIVVFRKFISPNTFKIVSKTGVKFSDVVGMENLKRDMTQIVEMMRSPESFLKRGIRLPKGVLLEGSPGNGKTLFARALAGEAKVNFIAAKATDFESMFMAIGPAKVKLLFRKARRHAPCIVFIDEFDGIGTKRNYSGSAIETENTRIVTALLNELDGFEQNNSILVVAATNSVTALDEALIRPGRFDAKYTIPFPDKTARKELIEKCFLGKKFSAECSPEKLADKFSGFSCAKIESVLNRAALIAKQNGREVCEMSDVVSSVAEM